MRTRKKMGNGKSVKVRDLPEDKSRTMTTVVNLAGLTTEEELVFRMRRGKPLATVEQLEFRGQDNDLTRHRLAAIEARVHGFHQRGHGHRS